MLTFNPFAGGVTKYYKVDLSIGVTNGSTFLADTTASQVTYEGETNVPFVSANTRTVEVYLDGVDNDGSVSEVVPSLFIGSSAFPTKLRDGLVYIRIGTSKLEYASATAIGNIICIVTANNS